MKSNFIKVCYNESYLFYKRTHNNMNDLKALCMKCRDANNKPTMKIMKDVKVEEKNNRFFAKGK